MSQSSLNTAMHMVTKLRDQSADLPAPDRVDLNRAALLLDVDGTLLDIAATPDDVDVPPDLIGTLERLLKRAGGAVALVSGRTIHTLDRLFRPLSLPAIGQHGAEVRITPHGPVRRDRRSLGRELRNRMHLLAEVDGRVLIEEKSRSMSVHFRRAPEYEALLKREVTKIVSAEAEPDSVEVMFGKAVIDIKPSSFSKGTAVRELMAAPPFAGRRLVFIGDDTTDESVFAILPDLGGIGFSVGRKMQAARGVFASPADVRSWLARVAEAAR